jgi:hypothetical protein
MSWCGGAYAVRVRAGVLWTRGWGSERRRSTEHNFRPLKNVAEHVLVEVKEGGNWPAWPHQLRLRIVCEIENEVVQCKARYEEVGRRQGCDDAAL